MLWTIVVILLILWLLGAIGPVAVLPGNAIHVLVVVALVIVVIRLAQGRKLDDL